MALSGVGDSRVQRGLRHADGERTDTGPEQVERSHRHREAVVQLTEQLPRPHRHAVEGQPADRVRRQHVQVLAGQAGSVARDDERADATGTRVGCRPREHRVEVGLGGVGDPRLLAGQPPSGAVGLGAELQRAGVGPGTGLGQGECRHRIAGGDRRNPPLHLFVRTGQQHRVGSQTLQRQRGLGLGRHGSQRLA